MTADVCNVLKWQMAREQLKILGPARGEWVQTSPAAWSDASIPIPGTSQIRIKDSDF